MDYIMDKITEKWDYFTPLSAFKRKDEFVEYCEQNDFYNVLDIIKYMNENIINKKDIKHKREMTYIKNKFDEYTDDISFENLMGISANKFLNYPLNLKGFSNRTKKRLSQDLSISNVAELMTLNRASLKNIEGMGQKSIYEIEGYLVGIIEESQKRLADIVDVSNDVYYMDVYPFIEAFTSNEKDELYIKGLYGYSNQAINYIFDKKLAGNPLIIRFLKWCSIDIEEKIAELLLLLEGRQLDVLKARVKKRTLKEIGEELSITRERVRQIEKKSLKIFEAWNMENRILCLISAIRNNDKILTIPELEEYFKENTKLIIYGLTNTKEIDYQYDKNAEVFVIGNKSLFEKTDEFIEKLPETFHEDKLPKIIKDAKNEDIDEEFLLETLKSIYGKTGQIYHKNGLSMSEMYLDIVENFYPNGIYIYDDQVMNEFRQKIRFRYDNVELSGTNRSIGIRIADKCILCDKGKYKIKSEQYISKELEEEIVHYIDNSEDMVISIRVLFTIFKDKLLEYGIDNKYYLYGVLREIIGDKYIFKKEYILKDEANTDTFYDNIIEFIKLSKLPVNKDEIRQEYPGVSDMAISMATADENILNFRGKYLHGLNLKIQPGDKEYLQDKIESCMDKNEQCSSKHLYDILASENKTMLNRMGVFYQHSLFSVLQYLFKKEYEFSRPFIGRKGKTIDSIDEQIQDFISEKSIVSVEEILEYTRMKHFYIGSIIECLNDQNETHLFQDKEFLASIDYIGITEEIAKTIENQIIEEIGDETVYIAELMCVLDFPQLRVPWNQWLIYSIINKWSERLEAGESNARFSMAEPVVALNGKLDISSLADYEAGHEMQGNEIGNLEDFILSEINDIDDILGDI